MDRPVRGRDDLRPDPARAPPGLHLGVISARNAARLAGLWALLTGLRWLAALPITEPRIFRDELLHWQMAKAFALHQPFRFFGHPIDYPAILYPALISVAFHLNDTAAFHLAQGLNAVLISAVVYPAYGLAREFRGPMESLAAAALAGLVPGGVYSALVMEESLYYPLFVLACWLGYRVLARGGVGSAVACAVAFCLAYFTKPLALVLVLGYALAVMGWSLMELLRTRGVPAGSLAVRALPLAALGASLLAWRALTHSGAGLGSPSELLFGGFYAAEHHGQLLPPLVPAAQLTFALLFTVALGTAVAPMVSCLDAAWRRRLEDPRLLGFLGFAGLVVGLYVLAVARHPLVNQDSIRLHERYVFPVAPLLFTIFFAAPLARTSWLTGAVVLGGIVLTVGPLASVVLTGATAVDAPSLTLPWLLRRALGGLPAAAATAAVGLLAFLIVRRASGRLGPTLACLAGLLVMLNAGWYAYVSGQTYLAPTSTFVQRMRERLEPTDRVTIVHEGNPELARLSWYLEFWLDLPVTGYWVGVGPAPWYADLAGPPDDVTDLTAPSYIIAPPGFEARCPAARSLPEIGQGLSLPVVVLEVPDSECRASPPARDVRAAAGAAAVPAPAPIGGAAAAQDP